MCRTSNGVVPEVAMAEAYHMAGLEQRRRVGEAPEGRLVEVIERKGVLVEPQNGVVWNFPM